jgi:endogenous inhibitor of DNA gyrase (YacG/DUF329 family)
VSSTLDCPHCGKQGITLTRKIWLGPAARATCRACGKKVSVPYTAMLAHVPFVAAILFAPVAEPFWLKVALLAGGFTLMSVVHMRWVPLAKR